MKKLIHNIKKFSKTNTAFFIINSIVIIGVLWFVLSFIEVQAHNAVILNDGEFEYSWWNFFKLLTTR